MTRDDRKPNCILVLLTPPVISEAPCFRGVQCHEQQVSNPNAPNSSRGEQTASVTSPHDSAPLPPPVNMLLVWNTTVFLPGAARRISGNDRHSEKVRMPSAIRGGFSKSPRAARHARAARKIWQECRAHSAIVGECGMHLCVCVCVQLHKRIFLCASCICRLRLPPSPS